MYQELKPVIKQIIESLPNSYVPYLKKNYNFLVDYLNTLPYTSFGERLYNWYYDSPQHLCCVCKEISSFKQFSHGYYQYCSTSCRAKDLKSYKNAHTVDGKCKGKQKLKEKAKNATIKRNNTTLDRYGKSFIEYSSEKRAQSYISKTPDLLSYDFCLTTKKSVRQLSDELDVPLTVVRNAFKRFNIPLSKRRRLYSTDEIKLCKFLDELNIQYERNNRTLLGNKQELDIFIPSLNVGIEYCGLFWHSDRNNYPKHKHQQKFLRAQERGIKLITLFEDEWLFNNILVKQRLLSLLQQNPEKIYARNCKVNFNCNSNEVKELLNRWHIAGARSVNNNVCLTLNDQIVSILTYGKSRYNSHDMELIRFASKPGCSVVGGFSKLFKNLVNNKSVDNVVSYSDNRWGWGTVYEKAGFSNQGITPPSYFYFKVKDKVRHHRSQFMKKYIVNNLDGNINLTEYDNMKRLGYNRIYDCGTIKWVWNRLK